ncbi:MAG TPA: HAMP domain-containing sensor histidine kinase, partial [Burkholderiaceae bacterium]|nr:HAMP domain-containing sensor histidine kinase [Burkholderiaceae bacterium]
MDGETSRSARAVDDPLPEVVEADRLAEALRELAASREAVQARDDFLSIAAHELRNPLQSLSLQLAALARIAERDGSEELARLAERTRRTVRLFARRATMLLDVDRINRGVHRPELETVELGALVDEAVELHDDAARHHGVELRVRVDRSLRGRWDRGAIDQVLNNLLSNAIKYGAGRPVELEAESPAPDRVRIRVRDGGPGITAGDRRRIFERFERLWAGRAGVEGFGLGLWLAHRLVLAHGGTIEIRSEPGRGSEFILVLPVDPALRIHPT